MTLRPEGKDSMSTDLSLLMGAVGVAGQVLDGSGPNGLSLNVRSDAMWIRTKTAKTAELVDTEGDVSRVRLILEGERPFPIGEAASLVPHAEIGVRVDGGDAETGAGIELGAGATYQAGAFSLEGRVRTLVAHEDSENREWGASGAVRISPSASGRGLTLSVAPSWGNAGSEAERLWGAGDATELGRGGAFEAERRLEAEIGYGLGVPRARGVVTPYTGLSLGEGGSRTWRIGARWQLGPQATFGLKVVRDEHPEDAGANEVMIRGEVRW